MTAPNEISINIDGQDVKYIRSDLKLSLPSGDFSPWEIGEKYFVQTVTNYYLGELVSITEKELIMTNVSWVSDTGRFNEFIKGHDPNDNEPYEQSMLVIIGRGAIVTANKRKICMEII